MKTVKLCVAIVGFTVTALVGRSQTYSIPWAQQQPAWVFPLWLEDGSGQKDTLYITFDPLAGSLPDSVFGVKAFHDTSTQFQATFYTWLTQDPQDSLSQKTIVHPSSSLPAIGGTPILFSYVQFPLVIRWDPDVLYSNSLPYANQFPAPTAQGYLSYDSPMESAGCSYSVPIVMTDSVTSPILTCYRNDSIVFTGSGVTPISIGFLPWTGTMTGVIDTHDEAINIFPNPAHEYIMLKLSPSNQFYTLSLFNSLGYLMRQQNASGATTLITADLPSGLYMAVIETQFGVSLKKILILH